MTIRRTLALASFFAAHSPLVLAQEPAPQLQQGFLPGEEMRFAIAYLHVPTGYGTATVGKPEGSIWPIICQARTEGLASLLDIREYMVSYWDSETSLSRGSDLHAMEVGDRHTDTMRFNRSEGRVSVRIQRRQRTFEQDYEVPPDARDVASALMYLRLKPLAPGVHYELPVFAGKRTFTLIADVEAREQVTTPAGRFDALRLKVQSDFRGKFSTKRDTFIWVTDDARHIPLRFSVEFAVGNVVATLTGYKPGQMLAER